jgi:hypothetical protein
MGFSEQILQELPLVFTVPGSPVDDLLAAGDEASNEMALSIWTDFRNEIVPRLESLQTKNLEARELREELHSMRGTSAQFGFFLFETFLFAWEKKEPDPAAVLFKYLPGAIVLARLSLDAIERDFPHLKSSPGYA